LEGKMKKAIVILVFLLAVGLQAQTGTINGTVVDQANDEAIAGATVILSQFGGPGQGVVEIDATTTNAAGEYTFADVPAGDNYSVRVEGDGFVPDVDWGIDLQADETFTSDFSLDQVDLATITGTVTNQANDEPVAGATVVLGQRTGWGGDAVYTPISTTTTNAAGQYNFADIQGIDNYYLQISADGYITEMDDNVDLLDLPPNETVTLDFALVFITRGNMYVFVQSEADESPVAGAIVTAAPRQNQDGEIHTGITDAQGMIAFEGAITMEYAITVSADGFLTDIVRNQLEENDNDTITVLLAAGAEGRTLTGTVSDADGNPVAGAEVVLRARSRGNVLVMTATTGDDGSYTIGSIPLNFDNGSLTVTASGYQEETVQVDLQGLDITEDINLTGVQFRQAYKAGKGFNFRLSSSGHEKSIHFELLNPCRVSLYSLQGRALLNRTFAPGAHALPLPRLSGSSIMLLVVQDKGRMTQHKIYLP
jgi:hypothetical protein